MEKNKSKEPEPFVVLKPSANEKNGEDIYSIKRELFAPNKECVYQLIDSLNNFKLDELLKVNTIKEKLDNCTILEKERDLKIEDAEEMAIENGCNILGGVYLNLISSFGVEIGKTNNSIRAESDDAEFMLTLYPDLMPFFSNPENLTMEQKKFSQGVIYNNTGSFRVIEVGDKKRIFTPEILKKITILKRIYRYSAKTNIPFCKDNVRCNLIHTPENLEELNLHKEIYSNRIKR
jgi:hypothetical protein